MPVRIQKLKTEESEQIREQRNVEIQRDRIEDLEYYEIGEFKQHHQQLSQLTDTVHTESYLSHGATALLGSPSRIKQLEESLRVLDSELAKNPPAERVEEIKQEIDSIRLEIKLHTGIMQERVLETCVDTGKRLPPLASLDEVTSRPEPGDFIVKVNPEIIDENNQKREKLDQITSRLDQIIPVKVKNPNIPKVTTENHQERKEIGLDQIIPKKINSDIE